MNPRTAESSRGARCAALFTIAAATASIDCQPCPCHAVALHPHGASPATAAAPSSGGGGGGGGTFTSAAYTWKNVVILGGGFVSGIIFSPAEKGLVYARTDVGGAYRMNPVDGSWVPITDEFGRTENNFMGIESIAPDPVDANRVYAAVGMYVKPWQGNGAMLRSSDRGSTWQRTDMPIKMGGNEYGRSNGERLAIDPNQRNVLFFGSRANGLWKSTDGSVTWSKASFPVDGDPDVIGIVFVVFDKRTGAEGKATQTLYAGVAKTDGSLYVSHDGGGSWRPVANQPTGLMASHAAFDASGMLYVSYGSGPGPNDVVSGAVYRYDPRAEAFTNVSPAVPDKSDRFGYGGLSVDASHPGTVMVSTIDRWTRGDEIFRTSDGGKTWKPILSKGVFDPAGAKYLYWDHDKPSNSGWMGDIDIDPFDTSHVLYVTGQGVWGSDDAAEGDAGRPTHWSFRDRGLEETVVSGLASPPAGPPLFSAVGDLGGFRHDDLEQSPSRGMFHNPIFGSGSDVDFAWSKPELVVRVGFNDNGKTGAFSSDGGATWTPFATMAKGKAAGSIAISADGGAIVWSPKEGPPQTSHDRGATWTRADGGPDPSKVPDWAPNNIRIAADRVSPKKFYVFDSMGGRAFASEDAGTHFVESHSGLPTLPDYGLGAGSIHAAPGVEGDVWITTGKELYRSKDSGKTYDSLSSVAESLALGFGKPAEGRKFPAIYLIGKVNDTNGFFRSDDEGATWVRINDDRHQFGFGNVISGDPRIYGRAYVGTGGRGILYGDPK